MPKKPVVWEDLATGKSWMVNNQTGEHVACTADGAPLTFYKPGVSGKATTSMRRRTLEEGDGKVAVWRRYLEQAEPPWPPPPDESLRADRVGTKGRFGTKIPSEIDLFLASQRRQRRMFPERVEAARLEEERARQKIDEMHKNFAALAASCDVNAPARVKEERHFSLSKHEQWAFTSTGMYRP